jgi:hypothetical protein
MASRRHDEDSRAIGVGLGFVRPYAPCRVSERCAPYLPVRLATDRRFRRVAAASGEQLGGLAERSAPTAGDVARRGLTDGRGAARSAIRRSNQFLHRERDDDAPAWSFSIDEVSPRVESHHRIDAAGRRRRGPGGVRPVAVRRDASGTLAARAPARSRRPAPTSMRAPRGRSIAEVGAELDACRANALRTARALRSPAAAARWAASPRRERAAARDRAPGGYLP